MYPNEILTWLRETDPTRLAELWRRADRVRQENVGGEVHLRGLIELSNYCVRLCGYCGLRAANRRLQRDRMTADEIMDCVGRAVEFGYGTVVLQSGEDPKLRCAEISALIERIKNETNLAVTLSLGERSDEELAAWREAGADRYLLRFETSNAELYRRIHPPREGETHQPGRHRLAILEVLRALGYEVGSGVMIGIPGQTYDDLAADVNLFARLDLDMIGVGPYLEHPETPLAAPENRPLASPAEQVPANELMAYKVIALTRLVCPRTNIPSTTALAALGGEEGRDLGLVRGANVIMPNLTPPGYRRLYEIYPNKACLSEDADHFARCAAERLQASGRRPGSGPAAQRDLGFNITRQGYRLAFRRRSDRLDRNAAAR